MSWRQPASSRSTQGVRSRRRLRFNFHHLQRLKLLEKYACLGGVEFRICRLNAQKESIPRGAYKFGDVENRMIRLRQTVERQHANYGRQAREQNHALKGDGHISGPGI